jgi:hypothetical protein
MPVGSAEQPRWLGELAMRRRLGEHSWVVLADGVEGVARPIALPVTGAADPTQLLDVATTLIGPAAPSLVPVTGLGLHFISDRISLRARRDRAIARDGDRSVAALGCMGQ